MAWYHVVQYNSVSGKLEEAQVGNGYLFGKDAYFQSPITTDSTIDGRDIAADGTKLDLLTLTGAVNLDTLNSDFTAVKVKTDNITISGAIDLDANQVKLDYLTVTQAVNLDTLEARVNELDASVVLMGSHDASTTLYPTATTAGESWIISVAGTIGPFDCNIGDRFMAIADSPGSNPANWLLLDYTDKVSSVAGRTGAVVLVTTDITDLPTYLEATDIDTVAKLNAITSETILTSVSVDTLAKVNALITDATLGDSSDFATAAQGALADSALQTGDAASLASVSDVDFIDFDLAAAHAVGIGQMAWNADDGTVDVGLAGGNVVLQLGQEMHHYVRALVNITNGELVYASGAVGASGKIEVSKFLADGSIAPHLIVGVATETITAGNYGFVTAFGAVRGLDTTGGAELWTEGTVLYPSATTPGAFTDTAPVAPNVAIPIAFVVNVHASTGVIYTRMSPPGALHDLNDVHLTAVADRELLIFDGAAQHWDNKAESTLSIARSQLTGNEPITTSITAFATGGQSNATQLVAGLNVVTTVATYGDSVKAPSAAAGMMFSVANQGAAILELFPTTSQKFEGRAANEPLPLAPNATVTWQAIDNTTWVIV